MDNKHVIEIKKESWRLFDGIAHRYDCANRLLSLGQDKSWRQYLVSLVNENKENILDLATGTGDVVFSLERKCPKARLTGIDPSAKMLDYARKKNKSDRINFVCADAREIPHEKESFDLITISFGIRNIVDYISALREMYRVAKKGADIFILEFSLPRHAGIRMGALFYLRTVVPIVGGMITGDSQSYRYLNRSIEYFPYGKVFIEKLESVGFRIVQIHELMLGMVSIYHVQKG